MVSACMVYHRRGLTSTVQCPRSLLLSPNFFFTPSPFLLSSLFVPLLAHCRPSVPALLSLLSIVISELGTLEQLRVDAQLLAFGRFSVAEVFLRARAFLPALLCCPIKVQTLDGARRHRR